MAYDVKNIGQFFNQAYAHLFTQKEPSKSDTVAKNSFFDQPQMLLLVFSYLQPDDVRNLARVCKNWKTLSSDNFHWKWFCTRSEISFEDNSTGSECYKDLYRSTLILRKVLKNPPEKTQFPLSENLLDDMESSVAIDFAKKKDYILFSDFQICRAYSPALKKNIQFAESLALSHKQMKLNNDVIYIYGRTSPFEKEPACLVYRFDLKKSCFLPKIEYKESRFKDNKLVSFEITDKRAFFGFDSGLIGVQNLKNEGDSGQLDSEPNIFYLKGHSTKIDMLKAGDNYLISSSAGEIRLWNLKDCTCAQTIYKNCSPHDIALGGKSFTLLAMTHQYLLASNGFAVNIWNSTTGELIHEIRLKGECDSFQVYSDWIFCLCDRIEAPTMQIFHLQTGAQVNYLNLESSRQPLSASFVVENQSIFFLQGSEMIEMRFSEPKKRFYWF